MGGNDIYLTIDIDVQIAATKELGWKFIETRVIGDKNLGTISNQEFEEVQVSFPIPMSVSTATAAISQTGANHRVRMQISKPAARNF